MSAECVLRTRLTAEYLKAMSRRHDAELAVRQTKDPAQRQLALAAYEKAREFAAGCRKRMLDHCAEHNC